MPYIEVLAQRHDVTVIVPYITPESRELMGWGNFQTSDKVRLIVSPTDEEVQTLFEEPYDGRVIALFTGISAFRDVKPWFRLSLEYDVERAIITEAPYTYRIPLRLHKLRFLIQDVRFVKYIKYVFAIGRGCQDYYRTWSSDWRVIPFAYCVSEDTETSETLKPLEPLEPSDSVTKFCFVGALENRKNVKTILKAFSLFRQKHRDAYKQCHLTIVGDGPLKPKLEKYVQKNMLTDNVTFAGTLPMKAARKVIASSNALILPSLYDGWGAVINEALTAGTMVYCSSMCGASILVADSPERGRVFEPTDYEYLAKMFWNDFGFFLDSQKVAYRRMMISKWAHEHIGPEAVAERMENALEKKIHRQ